MAVSLHRSTAVTSSHTSESPTTSSVLEFRCMFTHDVHKKQKKWHDGSLRFHVFNRRVMVYDETKNFVGDLHYRLAEEFGEGLELRLERPVLVQVEEQLGQSKTDLTPLFNRSKQDGEIHAATPQPSRATVSRINAANPQVKPKSIRELLGASQKWIGRARIPVESSYKQRHVLAEIQPAQPPAKRRRISSDKEIGVFNHPSARSIVAPRSRGQDATSTSNMREGVVELSSENEDVRPTIPKSKRGRKSKHNVQPSTALVYEVPAPVSNKTRSRLKEPALERVREMFKVSTRPPQDDSASNQPPTPSNDQRDVQSRLSSHCSQPIGIGDGTRKIPAISRANRPRSCLKFASQPRRPKLMYKALLVDASSAAAPSTSIASGTTPPRITQPSINSQSLDIADREPSPSESITSALSSLDSGSNYMSLDVDTSNSGPKTSHDARPQPQSTPSSLMQDEETTRTPTSPRRSNNPQSAMVADSPLFMPRTQSQLSPMPAIQLDLDEMIIPPQSQDASPAPTRGKKTGHAHLAQSQQSIGADANGQSPDSSPVGIRDLFAQESLREPQPAASTSLKVISEAPIPLDSALKPPRMKSRLFRRIVSETLPTTAFDNELPADDRNDDTTNKSHPLQSMQNVDDVDGQQRAKSRPNLQVRQTTSDSALLQAMVADQMDEDDYDVGVEGENMEAAEPIVEKVNVQHLQSRDQHHDLEHSIPVEQTGTGAWTPTEAFLLFDWWPRGKEKPDYGQLEPADDTASRAGGTRNPTRSYLVQNAHAMINKKYGTFGSAKFVSQQS